MHIVGIIFRDAQKTISWNAEKREGTLVHCWWEWKLVQPRWKTAWRFLKKQKQNYHNIQQFHSWVFI